jgi:CheY-like chemotaxis protein
VQTGNVYLDRTYVQMNVDARPGPYVMVAVRDAGSGIPAAIRDKVFEPFFTTKETGKGTGLGLSMVYGFVKQSGGHIKVHSQEGKGTAINLYLPRANELVDVRDGIVPVLPLEGGDETILVVEDDPLVRGFVTAQLQSLGYRTIAADDGQAALMEIDRHPDIDLLFTDVIMPGGLNGRQLADEAMRRRPNIRVLFTSGYPEDIIVHHGRLDAGVHLLDKPYRKAELARMIRVVLAARATPASGEAA